MAYLIWFSFQLKQYFHFYEQPRKVHLGKQP